MSGTATEEREAVERIVRGAFGVFLTARKIALVL